jgi:hypothetical protein
MMVALASLLCGLIFGLGLLISGMTQPAKVLGFLDIFGRWDPTLAFVMAAALVVSSVGFSLARQRGRPVLAARLLWPTRTDIDRPLVVGSALFGIGWALSRSGLGEPRRPHAQRDCVRAGDGRRDDHQGPVGPMGVLGHFSRGWHGVDIR